MEHRGAFCWWLLVAAGGIFSGFLVSGRLLLVLSGVVGWCRVVSGGGGGLGLADIPPAGRHVKNFHNVVFRPPSVHRPDVARHRPDVALMKEDTAHMAAATAHGRHPLPRCPKTLILVTFCQNISACQ